VKNLRALLDRVTTDGFDAWAPVTAETTDAASLAFRDLGE
jgi:histidyl-tRNA synthetase